MHYDVIVVGSGMVGTSIAWHLQKSGSQVLMLDKKLPGEETSYGNAGLIQREAIHVTPFPRQLSEVMRVLPNNSTDIRYRWSAMFRYLRPLMQYWMHSSQNKVGAIEKQWSTLIEHSTSEHSIMMKAADADNLVSKAGWIDIYRNQTKFNEAVALTQKMTDEGIEYQILSVPELQALEPNVNFADYVGGIHWKSSWQVSNPSKLVKAYARSFEQMQGRTKQATVKELLPIEDGWQVITDDDTYLCKQVVIAAGPWSAQLIAPLGYDIPLFPMRGYHQHFALTDKNTINHSLCDVDKGFVMGAMEQGIRITTGAEMSLLDAPKNFAQLEAVLSYARQVLPLESAIESEPWAGARPCLPDMKPIIGPASKHDKLWFAFGHGHQGFTLGPITGRLIEEMIYDKPLIIDASPFSSQRFD
ncbi:NAD(P)/FAD-dependent oxidoreductase [uncultured Psychrobacter sp.]|uniref:NAD(P)/FAD-dependent oxidoreductase n=1 Tax=uncultured Psychrobacter sp. TaxID=259303 RepID=UPI003458A41B